MKNIFIRARVNKCISIIENSCSQGGFSNGELEFLCSDKYLEALHILEDAGCIKCFYRYGDPRRPYSILPTHKRFSVYKLERHDVWVNRFWGFVTGVAVSIVGGVIINFLL